MTQVTPQATTNPAAFKFTIDGYTFDTPQTLGSAAEAAGTPFEAIFGLPGIVGIFATANFVTITKDAESRWETLVDPVKEALERAF